MGPNSTRGFIAVASTVVSFLQAVTLPGSTPSARPAVSAVHICHPKNGHITNRSHGAHGAQWRHPGCARAKQNLILSRNPKRTTKRNQPPTNSSTTCRMPLVSTNCEFPRNG
ncbi:hypothetical protein QBC43DRAFT_120052 [Cladorrhinum sp. PSN259]|nr:hypothetical protein QBC43DRAFT_120052 [Cladorrhinum sp. PSN259]